MFSSKEKEELISSSTYWDENQVRKLSEICKLPLCCSIKRTFSLLAEALEKEPVISAHGKCSDRFYCQSWTKQPKNRFQCAANTVGIPEMGKILMWHTTVNNLLHININHIGMCRSAMEIMHSQWVTFYSLLLSFTLTWLIISH